MLTIQQCQVEIFAERRFGLAERRSLLLRGFQHRPGALVLERGQAEVKALIRRRFDDADRFQQKTRRYGMARNQATSELLNVVWPFRFLPEQLQARNEIAIRENGKKHPGRSQMK